MDEIFEGSHEKAASGPSNPQSTLTWRDYAHILLERSWIVVTVLAVVVGLAIYRVNSRDPLYRATARMELDVTQAKVVRSDDVVAEDTRDYLYLSTQIKVLQSRSLAERMARRVDLVHNRTFWPASADTNLEAVAAAVQACVQVENVPGTRMVDITAIHRDPDGAMLIANELTQTFIQGNLHQRMDSSMEALRWLEAQAEQYLANLQKSEIAIQEYKEKTLSASLVDQQNVVVKKLEDISGSLTEAETQRLKVETEWRKIEALKKANGDLTQIDVISSDPLVVGITSELLNKQADIAVLKGRYRDLHPTLVQAEQELTELQGKLEKACLSVADAVYARLSMAQAQQESLRKAFADQQQKAFELDRKLMAYQELQRNVDADRELYNSVLARMKETSVAGKMETNNVRLVDRAVRPTEPFNIHRNRDLTQAVLVGLFLGVALGFLAHFADDRIKRSEDLELSLGVPVLAVIPRITGVKEQQRASIAEEDRHSPAAEAFRTLRASLALSPAAKRARKIMVTSDSAGAGKSLLSSNLSVVLAHNGVRTLLIDADLRRPTLHKAFGGKPEIGLSHVLAGEANWKDVVRHSHVPNLDVLLVGHIPPNPAELLGSQAMQDLLREVSTVYDKIIIDCPPVFGLSDPLILMPQTDGVIFVVHFNVSRRRNVLHALQKLREGQTPMLGGVMNNVDLRRPGGYYYYYHQYAYYYSNYGNKKRKRT
jgi:capsular exopolysaccharide synthesis family protein